MKSITIGNNVKAIKGGTFSGCSSLESIVIPNSVTSIGVGAFSGCSYMKSITIGDGVTAIGENVFKDCNALSSVYITDLSAWCNIDFNGGTTSNYKAYCNPLFNHAKLYLNNKELTELVIPEDITKIMSNTFYGCSSFISVTIGKNVTEIGWCAFAECPSLSSVTIGDGVTEIGFAAFADCSSLSKVTLGNSVNKIKERAFKNASIMECYSYNPTPPYIYRRTVGGTAPVESDENAFFNAIEVGAVLYVPKGSVGKYSQSYWDDYFYYYDQYNMKHSNIKAMD